MKIRYYGLEQYSDVSIFGKSQLVANFPDHDYYNTTFLSN